MRPQNTTERVKSYLKDQGTLAPSILSADFSELEKELSIVEKAGVSWIHVDVMDGHFVPNITIGPVVVRSVRPKTRSILDCHLMVTHPKKWVEAFAKAGADVITVHVESEDDLLETFAEIRKYHCAVGISLNPDTPVSKIEPYLDQVDLVLVMSVHPGFGGQKFIETSLEKVKELKKIQNLKKSFLIEIDGGVSLSNCKKIREHGVNVFVAGSAVFQSQDKNKTVKEFQQILEDN